MSDLEQYSHLNNIVVKGVATTEGDNRLAIVQAIGDNTCYPVSATHLDTTYRVPAKSETNMIARFLPRGKKTEFLSKASKARLNTDGIGFPRSTDQPLYFNDHLTPE